MWGVERSTPMAQFVWPPELDAIRAAPQANTYRTAFVIIAENPNDITSQHQAAVDAVRRYFDAAIPMLTHHRRASDTAM